MTSSCEPFRERNYLTSDASLEDVSSKKLFGLYIEVTRALLSDLCCFFLSYLYHALLAAGSEDGQVG